MRRPAGLIGRSEPLRYNTLAAMIAGPPIDDRTVGIKDFIEEKAVLLWL
jgi:hypothetical protein